MEQIIYNLKKSWRYRRGNQKP